MSDLLFVGGEPFDFGNYTGRTTTGSAGPLARMALELRGDEVATSPLSGSVSEAWAHCRLRRAGDNQSGQRPLFILRANGVHVAGFGTVDGSNGQFEAVWYDQGEGQFVSEAVFAYETFTDYFLDFHIVIAEQGLIEWFVDGVSIAKVEMDTTSHGELDEVHLQAATSNIRNSARHWVNEIMVGDFDLRGFRLRTLSLSSNGAETDWTGGVSDINGFSSPDTDVILSETADQVSTFGLTDEGAGEAQSLLIFSVEVNATLRREGGPERVAGVTRVDGDNFEAGERAPNPTWQSERFSFRENPGTLSTWTRTDLAGLELGLVSRNE